MNDAQSTIVGLKAQDCPGGGWNGMPAELEDRATVADCLANGVCGCIYGDAVQHIERLTAAQFSPDELNLIRQWYNAVDDLAPKYLDRADFALADKIKMALGMVPRADEQNP